MLIWTLANQQSTDIVQQELDWFADNKDIFNPNGVDGEDDGSDYDASDDYGDYTDSDLDYGEVEDVGEVEGEGEGEAEGGTEGSTNGAAEGGSERMDDEGTSG